MKTRKPILPKLLNVLAKKISDLQKAIDKSKKMLANATFDKTMPLDDIIDILTNKLETVSNHLNVV
jgi:uncharacterized protein YjgD (DUF1641 family)